jgi:alpha-L-fucosidase
MADTPLRAANGRHEWFWEPDDDNNICPLDQLMDMYEKSVGRNATLMVGLTPNPDGLIPVKDTKRLEEWGEAIKKRFGTSIAATSGQKKQLSIHLKDITKVNYCIIQENIAKGERVQSFLLQAKINGKWKTLDNGVSIGHKRIIPLANVESQSFRLVITRCKALPDISHFGLY